MRQIFRRSIPTFFAVLLLNLSFAAPPASAQYFGRNKVQYKDFKFEVLKTEHFDVYFYPEERDSATRVGRMAERWYARLSHIFGHQMQSRQPLMLYASHPDFEQTNVVGGMIGEGTGGVTEGLKRRVVLPLAGSLQETDHVLGHELVHAFQYDIAALRSSGGRGGGMESLPLWFVEGLAEYLSLGPVDPHTAMWLRDATRDNKLPKIRELNSGRFFPYRWGQAVWAYVGGKYGDDLIGQIFRDAVRSGSTEIALKTATGLDEKVLSASWQSDIRAQYSPAVEKAQRAHTFGRLLTVTNETENQTDVSPAISPDGRYVVYFSSRDLFSIDLYLAETESGRIIRKLVDTAQSAHFTSLQFIGSAGSWSPDSRQFVVGGVHSGKAVLAILDVHSGNVEREIALDAVGEVLNPSWSPDGKSIAFSGTVGGDSDLFIYDLATSTSRRITTDLFADLHPAWAPDGRRIAFVTDRFTSDAETLHAGDYHLAMLDVQSGGIEEVKTFTQGKSINPQWHPDGRRLYFVSDYSGASNVYMVDLESGALSQITNIDSGVSGITGLSPAISAAIDSRRLALSAYENGSHHIYVIDAPEKLASAPTEVPAPARLQVASLPPVERQPTLVKILEDATTGLPGTTGDVEPYKTSLSLDGVSQPYVSAGIDRFGGTVGGGIAFSFSDMLGNHTLYTQVSADSYGGGFGSLAKNTGLFVGYFNTKKRLNWGVTVEQNPYLAGGYAQGTGVVNGEAAFLDQTIIQRQTFRGANGLVAYPLNQNVRIEFAGGFTQTSYEQEIQTVASSLRTGRVISDTTQTVELGDALSLTNVSTALVSDSSIFGATSPIAGARSRFEVAPMFGDIHVTTALADYRHYFMPARFYTLAVRGLHYGRYGEGGEDPRLMPLFIGYPEFVRGYGVNSFEPGECESAANCPTFDRLSGSRMLVGNVELRFPLLRPFGVSDRMYGPLPVEVAFFLDSGVAWSKGDKPSFFNGSRKPVSSGGITLRSNVLGFAVAQIDYARPFDRSGRGWIWGFSLTPGF